MNSSTAFYFKTGMTGALNLVFDSVYETFFLYQETYDVVAAGEIVQGMPQLPEREKTLTFAELT